MKAFIAFLVCVAIGCLTAWAVSQGGKIAYGYSVFMIGTAAAFLINWLAFIPAVMARTEKYYDLTGSLTYLTVMGGTAFLAAPLSLRAKIVVVMVCIWALRLGSFLFARISRDGGDSRFDKIKMNNMRFLNAWTIQALWVVLTSACAVAIIASTRDVPLELWAYLGMAMWGIGFAIEVISDRQKSAFRKDPTNDGKFITSGLWAWSRHPNYFGEILLWAGIAVMAVPVFTGWQWVAMISPVFVAFLLTKVSGVPLLEAKANKKWGEDAGYQNYVANTPVLMLRPPRKA